MPSDLRIPGYEIGETPGQHERRIAKAALLHAAEVCGELAKIWADVHRIERDKSGYGPGTSELAAITQAVSDCGTTIRDEAAKLGGA